MIMDNERKRGGRRGRKKGEKKGGEGNGETKVMVCGCSDCGFMMNSQYLETGARHRGKREKGEGGGGGGGKKERGPL